MNIHNIQQQELQYDLYYQGSQQQLYSLLYPLAGPASPIFDHLQEHKVTFNPKTTQLNYTYTMDSFDNIDKQKEELLYTSKEVRSMSNYFYSTYDADTNSFVWRSVQGFLQMRPTPTVNKPKKESSQQQQPSPTIQLEVIQSQSPRNLVEQQIASAPTTQLKPTWYCSQQQYHTHMAN